VYPERVALRGPRARQQVVVLGEYVGGRTWDLTRAALMASSDSKVATVDSGGVVHCGKDGQARIAVEVAGRTLFLPVAVRGKPAEEPVAFMREIVPTLTKAGCNQGACHGGLHGKGGFRLSLLGYDPAFDYSQIVQSAEGRRVVLSDPERSILLLKPTLTMEHGGGERIRPQSDRSHANMRC
jgi:hypothetical protein